MEIASLLDPTGPTAVKIYAEAALLSQHSHLHGADHLQPISIALRYT